MSTQPPHSYGVELDEKGECARLTWICPVCSAENSEPYRQLFPEDYPLRCVPEPGKTCGYTYPIPLELLQAIRQKCDRVKAARTAGY